MSLLQALVKEIKLQKNYLDGETIETIYFGGGTPSLLSEGEINLLINTITDTAYRSFRCGNHAGG